MKTLQISDAQYQLLERVAEKTTSTPEQVLERLVKAAYFRQFGEAFAADYGHLAPAAGFATEEQLLDGIS